MTDGKGGQPGPSTGLSESSLSRSVLWLEAAAALLAVLSVAMRGWEEAYARLFNVSFISALAFIFIVGLAMFVRGGLKARRAALAALTASMVGLLMLSYTALIYEAGGNAAAILALAAPGIALSAAGIGLLVVKADKPSRLAGYYSMWLFGILMMLFMPLHELGALEYSGRDWLVGLLGLGISLMGSASFAAERKAGARADSWVTAGDAKYISGKYDEAVEYYGQAIYLEPKSPKVWANSGYAQLRLGLWAKAVASFDRALELEPDLAAAHNGRALGLARLKRFSEALEAHDRAIALERSPVGWNNKGNTLVRMGAPHREAVACYAKALEIDPEYEIAWFNKGKAELMDDDIPAAIGSLTRAVELRPQFADAWFQKGRALSMAGGRDGEALYCFDTAIELKPANAEAWMERKVLLMFMKGDRVRPIPLVNVPSSGVVFGPAARGQPLLEAPEPVASDRKLAVESSKARNGALRMATMGDYGSAIAALDARLGKAPDDVATHMTKGVLLSRIEKFDEALASFGRAAELKPDWVGPLFSRGMILAAKGEYGDALRAMDSVVRMRPGYADAWSLKGIILGIQRRYSEAIQCFDRALEINPDSEDAWRSKSTAYNKLGRYEDALFCYERLAALGPDMEETRRFLAEERGKLEDAKVLFRQGVDLAKSRLYDEGLALLKDAIALRPNYIDALYISGVIHGVRGNYPEAMEHFERVLEIRPSHVEAMYGKANILLKKGSYEKALDLLDNVLALDWDHVDAWCDRGVALVKLGKQPEALECYDHALKIAGDHPQAIAQRERCVKAMKEALGKAPEA